MAKLSKREEVLDEITAAFRDAYAQLEDAKAKIAALREICAEGDFDINMVEQRVREQEARKVQEEEADEYAQSAARG
ncbi:MAG: hypothetical protein QNJ62_06515 [Methyloceanibacter sp.]|nr:hypothetical protein [Methyloceanibacter sp.]